MGGCGPWWPLGVRLSRLLLRLPGLRQLAAGQLRLPEPVRPLVVAVRLRMGVDVDWCIWAKRPFSLPKN